jgi:hypothetical protein
VGGVDWPLRCLGTANDFHVRIVAGSPALTH